MKRLVLVALVLALPALAVGQPERPKGKAKARSVETITDPAKAGPDYQFQGEYAGEVPGGKVGLQIVAQGEGQFAGRVVRGGLPGDGWDGTTQIKFTAKREDGKAPFQFAMPNGNTIKGEIGDGKITATGPDDKTVEFKRVVRRSPTEGAKPPAGAVVLFDGTGADAWDNGKVENGLLSIMVRGGQTSKQKFADCTVHVEFILPYMPRARGQGRGNSGVYLQGRYEVQVLDSFGLEGKNNECGGIYEVSDPKVNMCYPPLQWQTFDIDYTAARYQDGKKVAKARMTVKHNGVVVQENVEVGGDTRAAVVKEGPDAGPLHLQNHGNPVLYRNIWVLEKK